MGKSRIVRYHTSLSNEVRRIKDLIKRKSGADISLVEASKIVARRSKKARFFQK